VCKFVKESPHFYTWRRQQTIHRKPQ